MFGKCFSDIPEDVTEEEGEVIFNEPEFDKELSFDLGTHLVRKIPSQVQTFFFGLSTNRAITNNDVHNIKVS